MSRGTYLPFRGLSAWFSCSVPPVVIQQWDYYGGILTGEEEADYLFSDDSLTRDTVRVYETQNDIAVVQSSWILEILQRQCPVYDVPLGQHLLQPHHLNPQDSMQATHSSVVNSTAQQKVKRSIDESFCNKMEAFPVNVNPPQRSASAMYAQYNGMWEALEARVMTENIEEIAHLNDIQFNNSGVALRVCDFVCTQPGFKVQRIGYIDNQQ